MVCGSSFLPLQPILSTMNSEMEQVVLKKAKAGSFQAMGLDKEVSKGLNRMGYKVPTPVQRKALPIVLAGMDCVCMARTGSGKTCVFLLPMMEKLLSHNPNSGVRGLVLSPTRYFLNSSH
jgi:ATP-dependent RNA helicase DDX54/DBP10